MTVLHRIRLEVPRWFLYLSSNQFMFLNFPCNFRDRSVYPLYKEDVFWPDCSDSLRHQNRLSVCGSVTFFFTYMSIYINFIRLFYLEIFEWVHFTSIQKMDCPLSFNTSISPSNSNPLVTYIFDF